jgi:NAD-dependent dihydropyrimidine dehydrogenase PreA subunit
MNIALYIGGAIILLWLIGGIFHKLREKNKVIHVIEDKCNGCQRCLKRCHHHVLDVVCHEKGAHVVVKYPDNCTACGDCVSTCKFNALEMIERNKETGERKCYS